MGEEADALTDMWLDSMCDLDDYDDARGTCMHCGRCFIWHQRFNGSWYLMTEGGREHVCKAKLASRIASPDEFPDMT